MTVGQKIKSRRIELGLSQDELAKKCGYKSRSSINKIEMSRDLPLKKVKQMANALDLSVSYLMGWDSQNEEEMYTSMAYNLDKEYAEHLGITVDAIDIAKSWDELNADSQRQIILMLAFLKNQEKKDK